LVSSSSWLTGWLLSLDLFQKTAKDPVERLATVPGSLGERIADVDLSSLRAAPQAERRMLLAADGIRVSALHWAPEGARSGAAPSAPATAVVLAHGFSGSSSSPGLRRVADVLAGAGAGVVALDFRGHGRSGGVSTVGDLEVLDLDAAVAWARLLGYARVVTVGFSMGGSVVVRHAAMLRGVDAVVSVSGPARWYYRGTPAMRMLHRVVERPSGRLAARVGLRTRIAADGWDPLPAEPRAMAGSIAPVPLLVVHGTHDRYFPLDHAEQLAAAAGPTAQLWVEPGFGHAENAISAELTARIWAWAADAVGGR
jgi:pimeloyl-ACP methyl ester carboxylesterase